MMALRLGPCILLGVLMLPASGRAGDDYFMLMFGSQSPKTHPSYSHTFATFVHVCWPGNGPCPNHPLLEAHTISWLPTTMVVRTRSLLSECGQNFDLHETLYWCQDFYLRVSLWGPFRICPELYDLAMKQIALLESGQVRYKAVDSGHSTDHVSNCIHAVSSVVESHKLRIASPGWGEVASFTVLKHFEPYLIEAHCVHPEIGSALGLNDFPIIYRDWEKPHSGPFHSMFRRDHGLYPTYGPPPQD